MERYQQLSVVGEGSYGLVLKCKHKETDQIVAIKKFLETEEDANVRKVALREIRMLKRLKHENLVTLIEVFRCRKRFYLVFEHLQGTVLDELDKSSGGLDERTCRDIIFQVTRAVHFCHMNNVIHRDIKPENVLVSSLGVVKLCDFGFARLVSIAGECCTEYVATRWYRAPELLIGDLNYGAPVDVWAIGCLYAEMMTGNPLFPGDSDIDQLYLTMKLLGKPCTKHRQIMTKHSHFSGIIKTDTNENGLQKLFSSWTSISLDFVSWCLKMDPQSRPTSEELLKHKLFTYDDFSLQFLRKLRQKVISEFNENPLLRHVRDQVIHSTDRMNRREELIKSKKLSQTSDTQLKQTAEPHKWQIKIGEAVKRKLSNDTINSCDNISTSTLNTSRTNQKRSFQSIQSNQLKESSLQTMIKEKISQEFASTQKLSSSILLPPTTQKRRSDIENLQKTSESVTKLNQKSDILRPASAQKEEADPSSPPRYQSLQTNLSDFKSPSRASLNSQHILHPSISNICFCKEPKPKTILQTIQNTSIRNTFNQLPLANPPKGVYIRKIDKGLYFEPPITIPDSVNQNNNVDTNFLTNTGNKIKKKEKSKYDEFTLPTCPGAICCSDKPNKKPLTSPEALTTAAITPRTKSSISQKSTNSHYLSQHLQS